MTTPAYTTEFRRDIRGNPVYRVEKSPGRITILAPNGARLGYMENGRSYDKNARLIAQSESEAAIIMAAGLTWDTR